MAHELIRLGLRLRDLPSPHLTYQDLAAIVRQAPPDSAIVRSMGPQATHTTEAELLRSVEYSLRALVWAKSGRGKKPEPLVFEWEKPKSVYEFDVMTTDEVDDFLGWDAA